MIGEKDASRIAFAMNTTDALNMAIHGALRTGDHVISTLIEHNSVLRPLSELSRSGIITLTLIPPDRNGRIQAQDVERAVTSRTRLVVMTHMSNVLGVTQDVAAVGGVCRRRKLLFLVDAAQTAGIYRSVRGHGAARCSRCRGTRGCSDRTERVRCG